MHSTSSTARSPSGPMTRRPPGRRRCCSFRTETSPTARAWGERLAALPGCRVGLNWQGNPEAEKLSALEARSFPLAAAAALARITGVSLVSLQKGAGAAQLAEVAFGSRLMQLADPH